MMDRGKFLYDKREEKGLSVPELAKILNVSEWKIERWEEGELPDSEHLLRLSSILGVSVEEILCGESADATGYGCAQDESDGYENRDSFGRDTYREEEGGNTTVTGDSVNAVGIQQSGKNGYTASERTFGYFVFTVFVAVVVILLAVQFFGWITRPREITLDNYKDYIEIDVVPTRNFNCDEHILRITAKQDVSGLDITLNVTFHDFLKGDYSETVTLSGDLAEGGTLEKTVKLPFFSFDSGYEVESVTGGLS